MILFLNNEGAFGTSSIDKEHPSMHTIAHRFFAEVQLLTAIMHFRV